MGLQEGTRRDPEGAPEGVPARVLGRSKGPKRGAGFPEKICPNQLLDESDVRIVFGSAT